MENLSTIVYIASILLSFIFIVIMDVLFLKDIHKSREELTSGQKFVRTLYYYLLPITILGVYFIISGR